MGTTTSADPEHTLQSIINAASRVHLAYLDRDFNFLHVNSTYAQSCGYRPEEMIGKNHFVLFPHAENEAIFKRVVDTGEPAEYRDKPFEFPDQPQRGVTYWDWTLAPIKAAGGCVDGLVLALVETTERKQAVDDLRQSKERFELLATISERLLCSDDPQGVLEQLCQLVMTHLDCQFFFNYLVAVPGKQMRLNACAGIPAEQAEALRARDFGVAICGCVARDGRRIIAGDMVVPSEAPRTQLLKDYGVQAYCCHPLMAQDQLIGTLSFGTRTRAAFTDDEVALMKSVADLVAVALQRLQAQERHERQVRLFDGVASTTPDFVYIFDLQGRFLYANRRLLEVWGMNLPDVIGKTCRELGYEQWHHDMHMREIAQVIQTRSQIKGEVPFEAPVTGVFGVYEYIFTPVIGSDGEVELIAGTTRDVTERKRAEQALRESEVRVRNQAAQLKAVLDTAPAVIWIASDRDCRQITGNRAASEFLRVPADTEISKTGAMPPKFAHYRVFHDGAELAPEEMPIPVVARTGQQLRNYTMDFHFDDGPVRSLLGDIVPMLDTQGRLTGAVGAFVDVTQRMGAEKALAERARLLDLSNDAILVRDARDRIVYWNAGAEEAYGYTKEEALGRAPVELLRTVYPQPVENIMESLQRDGRWTGELVHTRKDGEQITVATRWALNRGEQNNTAILEINSDITAGKRAEQSLRESEALYRAIARNFPDGAVYVFDHDLRFRVADGKAMAALGYSRESLEGKTIWEAVDEQTRGIIHQRYLRVLAGESLHYETPLRGRVFNSAYVPIRDDRQAVIAGMVVSHDITERKAAEESLRQARDELEKRVCERTAELQTRASQLARLTSELTMAEQRERQHLARVLHDGLQQLLVAAKFRLNVLESAAEEHVRQEAREVNELLSDSIETSRSLTAELSPSVLKSGLVPSLEWLARWMEEKHGLEVVLEVQGGTLPLDENLTVLLFQSVRELLFNVVKHAGVRNARIYVTPTGSSVQIMVTDEGTGFDTIRRLDDNQTGGFGLFAIRERLDLLGGCLQIDSAPGRGSRFTLRAPLSQPEADAAPSRQPLKVSLSVTAPAEPTDSDGQRRVRIALVDDHAVIRHGLAAVLRQEKRFYVIGEASDGKSAVELVRRLQPDVVLMDISMPGMNGIEATGIIHQEFPHVCVIGLSMHDDPHASQQMRQAGAVAYLSKSGPAYDIVQAILSCLTGGEQSR